MRLVSCYCVPPGKGFIMSENPCTWPDCPNGERPNPDESMIPFIPVEDNEDE